jgi:cytoskeletal protein RodZ
LDVVGNVMLGRVLQGQFSALVNVNRTYGSSRVLKPTEKSSLTKPNSVSNSFSVTVTRKCSVSFGIDEFAFDLRLMSKGKPSLNVQNRKSGTPAMMRQQNNQFRISSDM